MAKVSKKNIKNENEMKNFIIMILVVTVIFGAFYLLTILINKEEEVVLEEKHAEIQYDKILIGNMLSQSNKEYYVLVYDTNDIKYPIYNAYLSNYIKKEDALRVYYAELNNPLNQSYFSAEENLKVSKIEKLKIKNTTLFKIKDKKVTKYYLGEDIEKHLSEISETKEDK